MLVAVAGMLYVSINGMFGTWPLPTLDREMKSWRIQIENAQRHSILMLLTVATHRIAWFFREPFTIFPIFNVLLFVRVVCVFSRIQISRMEMITNSSKLRMAFT